MMPKFAYVLIQCDYEMSEHIHKARIITDLIDRVDVEIEYCIPKNKIIKYFN